MASLRGIGAWAMQNQAMGDALIVNIGGTQRCGTVRMANNVLAGGRQVPQFRFICDGYCGLIPKRHTKSCATVDQQAASGPNAVPVNPPPGLVRDVGRVGASAGPRMLQ